MRQENRCHREISTLLEISTLPWGPHTRAGFEIRLPNHNGTMTCHKCLQSSPPLPLLMTSEWTQTFVFSLLLKGHCERKRET